MPDGHQDGGARVKRWIGAAIVVAVVVPLLLVLVWITGLEYYYAAFLYVAEKVEHGLGLDRNLARAVAAVMWLPLVYFFGLAIWPFGKRRRYLGLAGLSAYVAAYSLLAYLAHQQVFFDKDGRPLRYYALTQDGYVFADKEGIEPTWGVPLRPVTREVIAAWKRSGRDLSCYGSLDEIKGPLFDSGSGDPLYWHAGESKGDHRICTGPGHHPTTGEKLMPMTPEMVGKIRKSKETSKRAARIAEASESQRQADEKRSQVEAAWRRARIDESTLGRLDRPSGALLLIAVKEGPLPGFEMDLSQKLASNGVRALTGVLKSASLEDEELRGLSAGDRTLLNRLGLDRIQGRILAGRVELSDPKRGAFEGLLKVDAQAEIGLGSLSGGPIGREVFGAVGTGYDKTSANEMAKQRLIDAILRHPLIRSLEPS
jgi:hypothetical protein